MSLSVNSVSHTPNYTFSFQGKTREENASSSHKTINVLAGLGALAAIGVAAVLMHNSKAAKKAFQEGFNHVEPTVIKETNAVKNSNEIIDRVEILKRNEGLEYKFAGKEPGCRDTGRYPGAKEMEKVDWGAKPISRNQALFEEKFYGDNKLPYINPDFEKEIAQLEKRGYKVSVKRYEHDNDKLKIVYTYPKSSPIESKTVIGKVADLEKGHSYADYDSKWVSLQLRDASNVSSYHLTLRNNFKFGDGGMYEFGECRKDGGYGNTWLYIKPDDIFENGVTKFVHGGNRHNKKTTELILKEFKKELGLA